MNDSIPWLILFLPLLSAVAITFFLQRKPTLSAFVSVGAVVIAFVLTLVWLGEYLQGRGLPPLEELPGASHVHRLDVSTTWLQVGALHIDFGMRFDALSFLMLLVVTGVGSLIHIYSIGYMRGDECYARFFACLSLFIFSMLGIVLSNNFFQMFVFWELVGLSSYLLIGFWYQKPSAADAAKKAFLTNRLGDFGFLAGIVLLWVTAGTLNFDELKGHLGTETMSVAVGLLIFCGTVGKSAQFPLHVWLPDAMEGPTPVSALIHAATMVAAGVYMLCRVFFIFPGPALEVIAWIGGVTALLAALIAVQQDDIKRILAYSTMSQLGYMVMAVGFAAPPAAMFHLTTHAFFKALLFLGAGSVIHALSQEQNIWKMGALRHKMPVTYWTFLAATLAICGMPPLSGFYSKDAILAAAWEHNKALFGLGVFVAFLTTFYMFRLFLVVFLGKAKSSAVGHAHESPPVMAAPLVVLAAASIIGGFIGITYFIAPQFSSTRTEMPIFAPLEPFRTAPGPALLGLAAFALGLIGAFVLYAGKEADPLPGKMGALSRLMRDKFYFDEFYARLVALFHDTPAAVANLFDAGIKLVVRLAHGTVEWTGRVLRLIQTGNLQTYTLLMAAGAALALYFILSQ